MSRYLIALLALSLSACAPADPYAIAEAVRVCKNLDMDAYVVYNGLTGSAYRIQCLPRKADCPKEGK